MLKENIVTLIILNTETSLNTVRFTGSHLLTFFIVLHVLSFCRYSPLVTNLFLLLNMLHTLNDYFVLFETGSSYVAQVDLKLLNLLPQSSQCWEYRCVQPHLAPGCPLLNTNVILSSLWSKSCL
jgi:hypothetical protein